MIDGLYKPIGKLVVCFQELEFMTGSLLIELLRLDYDTGFCVVSEMSFSRLVAALVSTAELRLAGSPYIGEIRILAAELSDCEGKRNGTLHSMFAVADGSLKRIKFSAKPRHGLKKLMESTSPQEIESHIEAVASAKRRLMAIVKKLQDKNMISHAMFNPKRDV